MTVIEQALMEVDKGNTEKGLELLQSYERQANDDEKFTIAQIYLQWGLIQQARDILEALHENFPKESEINLLLAEIYTDLEEDDKAIDILANIQSEDDYYIQSLLQAADLYQSQGLFEVAEQKLLEAKQLLPNEIIIDFALGELAFSSGEYKKSIPYYEKVVREQAELNDVNVNLRLAEALSATGKWENALSYYQAESESDSPDLLFKYGLTAYRSDRSDIAISAWEKLLEVDPHYQSVYMPLSKAYEQEGMIDSSYDAAKKGLEMDPFNKELFFYAGQLANQLGKKGEAKKHLQDSIAIDPGYKEAVVSLVDMFKKEEEYDEIKDLITELERLGETDPLYYWELARANYELEEYQLALNNYDEAYNSFTSDSDFLKEYGYILVEEGRILKAKQVFEQYLEIEPSDTEVEEFIYRISE
jgi:tetratricopeptide (TPR) repeat protein